MIPLEYQDVCITDQFFGEYVKRVSEHIIPHQWKILNDQLEDAAPTYCIQNFRIAAGEIKGERKGVVFQDTDLYKWLETVSYSIASGLGKKYEELADEVIELIEKAQEEDGYLNTYYTITCPEKKWTNLVEGHELYTSGHMIEAAVAYYKATKKEKFLKVACKNADLICSVFGTEKGQKRGYPGHQEIELALVKLYHVTNKRKYLECAYYFIRERGKKPNYLKNEIEKRGGWEFFPEFEHYDLEYSQAHMEPICQKTAVGHAVRDMYMCSAMADLALEYRDEEMLKTCKEIFHNVTDKRMYITGGIGSSGFRERFTTDYDLPNSTNYSETCASIGLMMFGQRMKAVTEDASYYDAVERALYNTVLAGINIEGDRYFYVNPLEMVPEFCTEHTYMDHVKAERQEWFNVACCPPNIARTLASLGQYIYAQDEDAVYIHQFISSTAVTNIHNKKISLEMNSQLLQTGKVFLTMECENKQRIKMRIPEYAGNYQVSINDKLILPEIGNGYLVVEVGAGNTKVEVDFDIKAKWMAANEYVRADSGKTALVKGPFVYCLEEADNGNLLSEIYVTENTKVTEEPLQSELIGEAPALVYQGVRMKSCPADREKLYGELHIEKKEVTLKAIPYCLWNNRGVGEMLIWHKLLF